MKIKRILVVDDEQLGREYLTEAVEALGYGAIAARDAAAALVLIEREQPDVVLTDLRMPEVDGVELTKLIQERWPDLPVMLCTAHASVEAAVTAMKHGARDFLLKPCSIDALQFALNRLGRELHLEQENRYLREESQSATPDSIVAESQPMRDLLRAAARVARSRGTVLITGESGTGKERIAQFIHAASPRAEQPFVRVNCAALSEQLLESELFGHERGAFTGADRQRLGRFELADGGTLLLDELGEISPAMQAKLLRVLQEDEFERVGGQKTLKVDVRVLAATNRDLAKEVAAGRFREDLYYRLHVLPLHIAPLRDRQDDIIPLARRFAEVHARRNGIEVPTFGAEALERLVGWSWPGNVRELENVIQRAVILSNSREIGVESLFFGPMAGASATSLSGKLGLEDPVFQESIANHTMADIERVAILATLQRTNGNKTEAARRLGLTARTLSNKLHIWRATGLVA